MGERGGQCVDPAIGPEQGRRQQHPVLRPQSLALADIEAIFDHQVMRERDRLWPAGGAGGVEDDRVVTGPGTVARCQGGVRSRRRPRDVPVRKASTVQQHDVAQPWMLAGGDKVQQHGRVVLTPVLGERYEDRHLRIGNQEIELLPGGPGAERGCDGTQQPGTESNVQPLGPVVDQHANPVAPADAVVMQHGRGLTCAMGEVCVAVGFLAADHRSAVSPSLLVQQVEPGAAIGRLHRHRPLIAGKVRAARCSPKCTSAMAGRSSYRPV